MRQELLASQKSGRGILLDPRTKLALLITISVFVLSGGIGVTSRQFAPVLSAVPLILMLTEGAWRGHVSILPCTVAAIYCKYCHSRTCQDCQVFLLLQFVAF